MREILFRGRNKHSCEWEFGCYYKQTEFYGDEIEDHVIITSREELSYDQALVCYSVQPETVGQFTGLTDKNGTKIFEGDVIQFHKFRYEPDWVGVVRYENCHYIATGRMPLAYEKRMGEEAFYCPFEVVISGIDKETIKVIGNIHDNPELLGGAS
jgi:uncharacterized phage protein (TIGR01671 family)